MSYSNEISERIIKSNSTILQALKKMDAINKKLLLVFEDNKFLGVLSIGDIQKAIIGNISLETFVQTIMRKDFLFAKISDDKKSILNLMQQYRIECMPILDESANLVSLYMWDDVFSSEKRSDGLKINLPVVIMAGGEGTRLKPLTNIIPKPLIPINDKTIIERIMDKFIEVGCNEFFLSVNYKADMIKYYFSNTNYSIMFIQEDQPLGTAGSLHLLKGKINSTFFVTNCDILIDQDINSILEYHKQNKNEITLVAALKHYPIPYGIVETTHEGLLKKITEKPEITFKINTGLYILEPNLIDDIPANRRFDITDLIAELLKGNKKVGVFPVSEKSWRDIGDWNEYKQILK